ncbi:MAG: hypothetical protein ABW098_20100 [Candidatus Thiodiazotropha sp.]
MNFADFTYPGDFARPSPLGMLVRLHLKMVNTRPLAVVRERYKLASRLANTLIYFNFYHGLLVSIHGLEFWWSNG